VNRIHILTEDVRNKIAAGEVIERPVSVIKELVENALDASSTSITVKLENGGKELIQIIDDGVGMSEDDALLAFERHATSKIRTADDIIHISTLGFRGEALPSIASVSRLTLLTREDGSETATRIEFSDGKLLEVAKDSANRGTTITVKGLFKNMPARRKFLRSETAELKHIIRYFHYQSLLYPEISFRLIVNGKEKLHYRKAEDIQTRLADVFGSKFFELDIIPLSQTQEELSLSGYIFGLEELKTPLIDEKYIFINGRYINDKTIFHSIRTAYAPFIAKTRVWAQGSTPPYILFLNLPPELIDFNVHPAKLEVRFRDQQLIHSFVKNAVTSALSRYEDEKFASARQKFHHASQVEKATLVEREIYKSRIDIPRFSNYKKELSNIYQTDLFQSEGSRLSNSIPIVNPELNSESAQQELFPEVPNDSVSLPLLTKNEEDYVNPWQLHNTYIFVQVEDGLVVIDQHAAHERILYEKMIHRTSGAPPVRQKLIFPIVVDIPPYIKPLVQEQLEANLSLLEKTGFVLKKFSGASVVVEEIPAELTDWQGGNEFIEILKQLQEELEENKDFRDSLAKSIACKAAIKANRRLSKKEMLDLINDLFACQTPYFCPHGRPLMIKMTLQEFEKRFKRIV
jgi:DNA mismatch repair protein MutL